MRLNLNPPAIASEQSTASGESAMASDAPRKNILDLYNADEFSRARELLQQELDQNDTDGRNWELLGLIEYAERNVAATVDALERASLLVPLRPAARLALANAYAEAGHEQLSRELLAERISDSDLCAPLLLQVAASLDLLGEPTQAIRACRAAQQADPDHAQTYYDMGYYAAHAGYPANVTESLARRAISLDPENACFRVGLATMLLSADRDREAYELVRQFSARQIEDITCTCCLRRVARLIACEGNEPLAEICRARLARLMMSDEPDLH